MCIPQKQKKKGQKIVSTNKVIFFSGFLNLYNVKTVL